ncbi:TSC22 domain family protein 2 [Echinops telfairi]|uniref:TSC22 domain family protein 2 n=1 Tax=Echinops telfairi TaxID=9371 RepID=A0AC55DGR9_ECHTE|nr:TSC22 domain family protein 2 [Echinops telfairi]
MYLAYFHIFNFKSLKEIASTASTRNAAGSRRGGAVTSRRRRVGERRQLRRRRWLRQRRHFSRRRRRADDARRKSEPLPQPPLALLADHKPAAKPPAADALANPLQLTPMNSLATSVFSIAIPVDGDDDRIFFRIQHRRRNVT